MAAISEFTKDESTYRPIVPKSAFKGVTQWLWAAMAIIGLLTLVNGLVKAQRMLASRHWPTTVGRVAQSELTRGVMREGALKYRSKIVYRFTVDGHT